MNKEAEEKAAMDTVKTEEAEHYADLNKVLAALGSIETFFSGKIADIEATLQAPNHAPITNVTLGTLGKWIPVFYLWIDGCELTIPNSTSLPTMIRDTIEAVMTIEAAM